MLRFLRRTFGRRSMQLYARGAAGRGAAGLGDERDGGPRGGPAAAAASSPLPAAPGGSVFPAGGGPLLTGGAAVHISAAGAAKATLYCRVFLLDGTEVSVDLPVSDGAQLAWALAPRAPWGSPPPPVFLSGALPLHLSGDPLPLLLRVLLNPGSLGGHPVPVLGGPIPGPRPLLGTLPGWVTPSLAPTESFGPHPPPQRTHSPSPQSPPPGAGDRCSPPPPRFQPGLDYLLGHVKVMRCRPGVARLPPTSQSRHQALVNGQGGEALMLAARQVPNLGGSRGTISALA